MSKLLTALGFSNDVINKMPNDVLQYSKLIEGFQDVYTKIDNEDNKGKLAVFIANSIRALLKLINKYNSISDSTIGLPSTDPRTWDIEYEIGDVVRIRKDFAKSNYADENSELIINQVLINDYAKRTENPSGKVYYFENHSGGWEGKDLELVRKSVTTTTTTTSTTTAIPRPTTTTSTTTAIPRPTTTTSTTTAIPRPTTTTSTTTAIPRPTTTTSTTTAIPRRTTTTSTTTAMPRSTTTTTTTTTTKIPYKSKRQVENAIKGLQFLVSIGDADSIALLQELKNILNNFK